MARILILDDVLEAVKAIEMILAKKGHEIFGFTDESQAIEYVRSSPVDLAILDIKLKHRDGVEVLNEIKRIRPELKVIMLTGYPTRETATESSRIGADAYCIKPIDRHDLESIVSCLLLHQSADSA
jgi:DNA-binding NtrC family response regulator